MLTRATNPHPNNTPAAPATVLVILLAAAVSKKHIMVGEVKHVLLPGSDVLVGGLGRPAKK